MSAPVCPRRAGEPAPLSAREEQLYGVQTSVLHRDAEHAVYRLRSSDDIEKYVQLPTLGVMPKQSKKPAAKGQNTPNRRNSKKESEQK